MEEKKKVLVIGGLAKNIPKWISNVFELEHYEQQIHFKRTIAPDERPDVVVALRSWISHKQHKDARDYAVANNIPFISAENGWAQAVQQAMELGLHWFAKTVDKALPELEEPERTELDVILDRAWENAFAREKEKVSALERRLRKDRNRLEQTLKKLSTAEAKEEAAERVLVSIREAAQKQKTKIDSLRLRQNKVLDLIRSVIEGQETLGISNDLIFEIKEKIRDLYDL